MGEGMVDRTLDRVHELGDVVRALDELTAELRAERRHRTDELTNLLGQFVNGALWAGTVTVPLTGAVKLFQAPFAAVMLGDPDGIGPLFVANVGDTSDAEVPGPGRYVLAKSDQRTFPLTGRALSIVPTAAGVVNLAVFVKPPTAAVS